MSTTPLLHLQHLQKNFGHFRALKDVTFDVYPGEVFGFIGPNGAGKSTTIRILLGLIRASGGTATLFGRPVWQDSVQIHQRLAYVPGDVYLWPNLTGGEIIDLLLRMNDQAHTTQMDTLIHQFGLDPTKEARTYSKGNRQKVALIAALSQEADFYIFDEPTSGLDPLNERLFQAAVLALKKRGKAVLLSSHILSEVERMCDRIGIIREGQIIETGSLAAMRHLTRTTVTVTLGDDFDVTTLPGLHAVTPGHAAGEWQFSVDADSLAATMTTLAEHHITALQSTPPTLEDLFMHYYAKE
ncbi:ABC transporter ATP-binding protein [Levilactobacillus brevis]|uniref:ABC transporter ATP-binding protein n=1 Tax=Levilactobacillus brevis TaxID=1580 RepID=UPI000BE79B2C|nr:ABC transporter ATP-binding protein [Levilactobacillus brevis]MCZ2118759.1 ABC transporter ATP-binding protein [Levilactobacillus brevis]MCZ2124245.1 ABC transporter ATP-binding protein [Levilactobacillus brevis]MCZ2208683.1 ABC transporter ATP-binding protein [Levilactobacillus brevis]MCZ2324146.1 ABC transporter ATP-binding protein [Levilactobacillus brevis]